MLSFPVHPEFETQSAANEPVLWQQIEKNTSEQMFIKVIYLIKIVLSRFFEFIISHLQPSDDLFTRLT